MNSFLIISELIFSSLLGGLVGLEREFNRKLKKTTPIGIRTMVFITMLGTLTSTISEFIAIAGFFGIIAIITISFYARYKDYDKKGLTTYTASIIMYFTGVLVSKERFLIALSITAIITALLSLGNELKRFANLLTRKELKSTILFVIIAFVILPLLPNKVVDSLGLFNPFQYWLLVVLISTISFISYIFLKLFKNGLSFAGFLGGFVNAKITIYELINEASLNHELRNDAYNGILLSSSSALLSILLISFLGTLDINFLFELITPLLLISGIILLIFIKKTKLKNHHQLNLSNPFSLTNALKLGFLIFLFMQSSSIIIKMTNISLIYPIIIISALISSFASTAGLVAIYNSGNLSSSLFLTLVIIISLVDVIGRIFVIKLSKNNYLFKKLIKPFLIWVSLLVAYLSIHLIF